MSLVLHKPSPNGHGRGYVALGRHLPTARVARIRRATLAKRDLFTGIVFDQGGEGSCASHASSGAIDTTLKIAGAPLGWIPSPDGIYRSTLSLMRGGGEFSGPLDDYGSDMTYVEQAIGLVGVKPMGAQVADPGGATRFSDCNLASIKRELTLSEMETDGTHLQVGAYEIPHTFAAFCDAISAGYCVLIGTFVDMAFENWDPSQAPIGAPDASDPNGGGHAIRLDGFDGQVGIGTNSWSTSWGESGRFRFGPAFIENPNVDFLAAVAVHTEAAQ